MCIDFTLLNKACPKDDYPLPRIHILVDFVVGCEMMSLLDYFSGYHQIWMRKIDKEKTSFITPFGVFFFVRMLEGLRNAGPTFKRMIQIVLGPQLRRNVSTYVDDVVVQSKKKEDHTADLCETFANLRKYGLNLEKCVFDVKKGKLLGCMVSKSSIQANLEKIKAIREMKQPRTKRDIQKLTERIAVLGRFISRSAERSLPFFRLLAVKNKFVWGAEEQKAFEELKAYLENMAVLTSPGKKVKLLLYITSSNLALSTVLVEESEVEGNMK